MKIIEMIFAAIVFLISIMGLFILADAAYAANKTIRIAVLDTGFDRDLSNAKLCPEARPFKDSHAKKHGTNIVDLINQNAVGDYCILPIAIFTPEFNYAGYIGVLKMLNTMHIDVLNLSYAGHEHSIGETAQLKRLLDKGVIIFAAAGNNRSYLTKTSCTVYPACADSRITIVGDYDKASGFGPRVSIKTSRNQGCLSNGSYCLQGTSQATAIETGRFVRRLNDL